MSKVRNWRRRADDDEEDEPATTTTVALPPKTKKEPKKTLAKPSPGPKLLSFMEDDDADGQLQQQTKVRTPEKQSSFLKHKIEVGKAKPEKLETASNVQAQVGEYTNEKLLELQRNTQTLDVPAAAAAPTPEEPVVLLKGLLKPKPPPLREKV